MLDWLRRLLRIGQSDADFLVIGFGDKDSSRKLDAVAKSLRRREATRLQARAQETIARICALRGGPDDRMPQQMTHLAPLIDVNDPDRVLQAGLRQIAETPDYDVAYYWVAGIHRDRGDVKSAMQILNDGLAQARRTSYLLGMKGELLARSDKGEDMFANVSCAVIAQDPLRSQHTPYLYLAAAYEAVGLPKQAARLRKVALAIRPDLELSPEEFTQVSMIVHQSHEAIRPLADQVFALLLKERRVD